jgi:type III pantothenate kinase
MRLEFDLGNTRIKWRVRAGAQVLVAGSLMTGEEFSILNELLASYKLMLIGAAAVSVVDDELENLLADWCHKNLGLVLRFVRSETQLAGVVNGYENPSLLGADRWMGVVAAYGRYKGACVVVSCGTATTLDLVNAAGRHMGGYIAPGYDLWHESLNLRTHAVNVVATEQLLRLNPGVDTQESVSNACAAMMQGLINNALCELAASSNDASINLVVTGGHAPKLISLYPQAILIPNLVMDGLTYVD